MQAALRGRASAARPRATAARLALALAAVLGTLCAAPGAVLGQQPIPTGPQAIDGPSSAIPSPSGLDMSIARDGTGGLVYLKQVGGIAHVFVSLLQGGSFRDPVQLDAGLSGPSSQPVIAAGDGGLLQVAFINGGELYVAGRTSQGVAFSAPAGLAAGALNPAISITDFGKAYLAFTLARGSGYDVRTAYYYGGRWALEAAPLNVSAADNAGAGAGAPAVAAAGDGVAIVVWGEDGHVFSRRVWATTPSVVDEQADAPPPGCTEAFADSPVVGTGGDSSYAQVVFHEVVTCNGQQQSRVLADRLHGSVYDGLEAPDGLSESSTDGAQDPQITMGEYGHGWITSVRTAEHDIYATTMGDQGVNYGTHQVNGLSNAVSPDPIPATAGLYSNFIAWQQNPGSAGLPEVRVRYSPDGSVLGPEVVASTPAQGPTDAAAGLAAAGDVAGDAAVAWLQGGSGSETVVAEQMYQPPGPIAGVKALRYENTDYPILQWVAAHEPWGPVSYTVTLDGTTVAQTTAASARASVAVADGPHRWQVSGTNPAGQSTQAGAAIVFVDTVPPTAAMTLYGRPLVGSRLHVYATYIDLPQTGEPPSDASGIANVVVRWGDGTVAPLKLGNHRSFHSYRRAGHYVISLLVSDRAGNVTREVLRVVVVKPKPKRKPGRHSQNPSPPAKSKTK